MKVGIVGSRARNSMRDRKIILDLVTLLTKNRDDIMLVSSGCPQGADNFAEQAAVVHLLPIIVHRPEGTIANKWEFRNAAFARNKLIAQECDVLYALCDPSREGGTENTIQHAKDFGKAVWVDVDGSAFYLEHEPRDPNPDRAS
ncbi:MAG: hypothetical protein ACYDHY_07065 [Acidiferrobacterales bacterium]